MLPNLFQELTLKYRDSWCRNIRHSHYVIPISHPYSPEYMFTQPLLDLHSLCSFPAAVCARHLEKHRACWMNDRVTSSGAQAHEPARVKVFIQTQEAIASDSWHGFAKRKHFLKSAEVTHTMQLVWTRKNRQRTKIFTWRFWTEILFFKNLLFQFFWPIYGLECFHSILLKSLVNPA